MSTSLDIISYPVYQQIVEKSEKSDSLTEAIDMIESYSIYSTNFSGQVYRIYEVLDQCTLFRDNFVSEYSYIGRVATKRILVKTIESSSQVVKDRWSDFLDVISVYEDDDEFVLLVS